LGIKYSKFMKIGVPKEIKKGEFRVAMTPDGVLELTKRGHSVLLEKGAGLGSGFTDEEYNSCGATIFNTPQEIFERADMIVKVKEPQPAEYSLIRENQIIFTYFHFASSEELTQAMIASKATCIAYETVQKEDKSLPLLTPMSEIAGRMSIQEGAKYLEKNQGGSGILLGGIPSVKPAKVVILGGGVVGYNSAKMALGLGADVTIMDVNLPRLRYLSEILPTVKTVMSTEYNIRREIKDADLVIGAVLVTGKKAPRLITKDMLKTMREGSVIVDVAIDQGGCIETAKPTTHDNPTYVVDGVLHYCVANIPGAVPRTSTVGLTNATLPYILELANKGFRQSILDNIEIAKGVNISAGRVTYLDILK
jgi:alanine dehydrogenase